MGLLTRMFPVFVVLLFVPTSECWYNFNFKLAHKTEGMEDFPSVFNSLLRDKAELGSLKTVEESSMKTFEEFMDLVTQLRWDEFLQPYFVRVGISQNNIDYMKNLNVSDLMQQIPRYDLNQFWDAPIKTLVYRTAFYFSKNGTTETLELLQRIYTKDDIAVAKKIDQFKAQYPNSTYINFNEVQSINKNLLAFIEVIQFDETKDFIKLFNATNQLNYLTTLSFDYVNKVISKLVYNNIQRDEVARKKNHAEVLSITNKIQLFHSSIYQWSLSCQDIIKDVVFTTATLDSISERCFGLPFSQTAYTLYGVDKERGQFLGRFDMVAASSIAETPFRNVSLQPAKLFIGKMLKGFNQIDQSKALPFFEYARKTFIPWETIKSSSISTTLVKIQNLPWNVLSQAYGISEASSNSIQYVPFHKLVETVKTGAKSDFLNDPTRLRIVSADTIFSAVEGKVDTQHLRAAYRANVLTLSSKPLQSLKYIFTLNQETLAEQTLFDVTSNMYGLRLEELIAYFGLPTASSTFFKTTKLKDYASLLGLDMKGLLRFSIMQMVEQVKPEWTFAEAMLVTPLSFIQEGKSKLEDNLRFSIPQIVDTYHKTINSAQAFTAYIKVWSKSDETARIVKEEGLSELATRLKIQTSELANMKIIDIINTVIISFGEICDKNQGKFCAALQDCTSTGVAGQKDRCRCEHGYRFSKDKKCIDLDECLFANVTCHKYAQCINTKGSFKCQCRPGFNDENGDGYACTNINECETGNHNCHDKATCFDTDGAFTCSCNRGYQGNGRECEDVDECAKNSHNCHRHAICTNELGSFRCRCKQGYSGENGLFCLDIDECDKGTNNCPSNSVCRNTHGDYECLCKAPYVKSNDGQNCDLCRKDKLENCHPDALCLKGSCVCKDGYKGNGQQCEDVNECTETLNACGAGRCRNTLGDFECTCVNGYRATPPIRKCLDINECEGKTGHLLCNGTGETCTNTDGGYACVTVKSDKSVKIALGTAIPLIIIMFIGIFTFWFLHRRHQGKKELDNFDAKLKQMYINDAFTRDDASEVSGTSSRPIAPNGRTERMSMNNFMPPGKTFMNLNLFKKSAEPDEMKKTEY